MTTSTPSQAVLDIHDELLGGSSVKRRYVDVPSGRRVHALESGDGPPVLLLHGSSTSSLSHLPLHTRLTTVRAISVDRPGCGLSEAVPVSVPRFREDAVRFVDEVADGLGLASFVVGGNSMGGIWALWYALAHPDRVRGVALLGSVPTLPGTRVPPPLRVAATPVLGDLLSRVVKPTPQRVVRLLSSVGEGETVTRHPDIIRSVVVAGNDPMASAMNLAELRAVISMRGYRRTNSVSEDDLRRLGVPTLLIWGDKDPVGSVACAAAVTRLIPDARLEVLPGGHVPWFGHPDDVCALLSGFTREHSPS